MTQTHSAQTVDLGALLSSRTRSYCTYLFELDETMASARDAEHLNAWLGERTSGRSAVFKLLNGRLAIRIDHELVDAQRGLAMILDGLAACADGLVTSTQELEQPAEALEPHWTIDLPAAGFAAAAKAEGRTVTQRLLSLLRPSLKAFPTIRLIVSNANTVGSASGASSAPAGGNHFVPVDLTPAALDAMLERSADDWRRLISRLTKTALSALRRAEPTTAAPWLDALTVTSVGTLDALEPIFARHGIKGMTMYPERVSYCSSVVTVYSLFGKLRLVFSGAQRLPESIGRDIHDIP